MNHKSVFICVFRGRLIIRGEDYSLGNISLDLFSHRLHRFSQIFCCLGNSCLQMSGCVVRMEKICVSNYRPPLTPPEVRALKKSPYPIKMAIIPV